MFFLKSCKKKFGTERTEEKERENEERLTGEENWKKYEKKEKKM
jgi:hypothetical protein